MVILICFAFTQLILTCKMKKQQFRHGSWYANVNNESYKLIIKNCLPDQ